MLLRGLCPVGLFVLCSSLAPVSWGAPFPVTGIGFCPGTGSGISEPLAICTQAFGFNGPSWNLETGFPHGSGSESQSDSGAQAAGTADIVSTLGYSSIDLHGEKLGLTSFGAADITARTHWNDSVTLDAAGLTGQSGTFQAVLQVSVNENLARNLGSALSAFNDLNYRVEVVTNGTGWGFAGRISFFEDASGIDDRSSGDPPGLFTTGDLGFVFGTAFALDVETSVNIEASVNGGAGTAVTDAVVDVRWLGFSEVRDAGGDPVTGYSLSSDTGTDWSQASVPEPSPVVLLLGVLFVAARRRGGIRCSCAPGAGS